MFATAFPTCQETGRFFRRMAWAVPKYDRQGVDEAGRTLLTPPDLWNPETHEWMPGAWEQYARALAIINNWRSSHSFPLNTFQMWLRRTAHEFDPQALVPQRIKRLSSIEDK